ncbi:MAG: hypothetical protein KZQ83_12485 [gamma proteobacterium symbiont of Taylorina sp.]|nr:hypothetical protein [gamma proteobacterium symbiont of Taylorina sp.]
MSNTKNNDAKRLQRAITDMDALSQEGFSKIEGTSNLAVKALEQSRQSDDELNAFKAISGIAIDLMNCINCEAEEVGCHYTTRKIEVNHGRYSW